MRPIILFTFLFYLTAAYSQSNLEDVVYLKNGSIIHGIIIEQVPNTSLKIKNHSGDVFFYKIDEVEKMTKEEPVSNREISTPKPSISPEHVNNKKHWTFDSIKTGPIGIIEFGVLIGLPHTSSNSGLKVKYPGVSMFDIRISIDKMISRQTSIGGGFGFNISSNDPLNALPQRAIMVPAFFDIRYAFLKKKVSPYLGGNIGAAFYLGRNYYGTENAYGGGALGGINFGVRGFVSKYVALNCSLGYKIQHLSYSGQLQYTDETGNNTIQVNHTYTTYTHFISLLFGVQF